MLMKHFWLPALMLAMAATASAQVLNVASIERVNVNGLSIDEAVISPDGTQAVVSLNNSDALRVVNLSDGSTRQLTQNGLTHDLRWTADSKTVVYQQPSYNKKHLRYKEVKAVNLATGKEKTIQKATRNLNGVAVQGQQVQVVNNNKVKATALDGQKVAQAPVASISYGHLMLTQNGKTVQLDPNGSQNCSYLWPSVSPDGTKIVYFQVGKGCQVCDLQGNVLVSLGQLHAPAWLDNNTIVAMNDKDNGVVFTSSEIVAANLQGERQVLTDSSVIAMNPTAAGNKIAFTTPQGEMYIINVTR